MFLVVTQVIALLATSGLNDSPVSGSVNDTVITLEDLKAVNDDLKQVNADLVKAINSTNETDVPSDQEIESDTSNNTNTETESIATPVMMPPVTEEKKKEIFVLEAIPAKSHKEIGSEITLDTEAPLSDNSENIVVEKSAKKIESKTVLVEKSFNYIKYDDKGNAISNNAEQWACVHDHVGGLTWEVKSKEDGLRNTENLYSWFDPEENVSRGITDGGRCKGNAACDTHAYIKAMNKESFCGHNDWRLPTRKEMMGLVSYSDSDEKVTINTSYFPETLPSWYWTASSNESHPEFAWYILFKNGLSLNDLKENPKHIRLVRSN